MSPLKPLYCNRSHTVLLPVAWISPSPSTPTIHTHMSSLAPPLHCILASLLSNSTLYSQILLLSFIATTVLISIPILLSNSPSILPSSLNFTPMQIHCLTHIFHIVPIYLYLTPSDLSANCHRVGFCPIYCQLVFLHWCLQCPGVVYGYGALK